jgi:SAM-dependent methyltransferase
MMIVATITPIEVSMSESTSKYAPLMFRLSPAPFLHLNGADDSGITLLMTDIKGQVQHEYDGLAADYDRRWRRYVTRSVRETVRRANLAPGARVLDVGCGSGALLNAIERERSPERAIGIDLSLAMAALARRRLGSSDVIVADAEGLPFSNEQFDVILSSSSFHFWPNQLRALTDFRRVLRPNGRIVITDWCDDFLACRICDAFLRWRNRSRFRILTSREITALLADSGFELLSIECYKISWVWGLMTVVAMRR